MTIAEALVRGKHLLSSNLIDTSGLDASLLLAKTLRISQEKLILRGPEPLPETEILYFFQLIDRRIAGECTAYILGRKEFRGLDFLVNPAVLVPRPDTETLVEAALEAINAARPSPPPVLLDMCTASGAVAVALKNEYPEITMFASDISGEALETARFNAVRLLGTELEPAGTELKQRRPHEDISPAVTFIHSDLFDQIPRRFHFITANPPYVRTGDMAELSPEIRAEPRLALDGGEDGLDIIRLLIGRAPEHLFPGGALLLEADPRQMPLIASLLEHQGFLDIQTRRDLSGAERVIGGRLREEVPD
jgi:release factor glutamine methyltransferase